MPRQGISDDHRRALRAWFFSQSPRPSQKAASSWFNEQFGHRLRQSTISESLSERFSYLDVVRDNSSAAYRSRTAQWPLLESILFDWHRLIERQGGLLTGDLISEKARQIWQQIPQYRREEVPSFSSGWLEKFKRRHNIKKVTRHGDADSVPAQALDEMRAVQTLCGQYHEEDIYNMDETGLYWRKSPASGLASEKRPGIKRDKTRITLVVCVNFTGSHRLPIWVIGKSQRPRALKNVNLRALGCEWRANKKAWMNTIVMSEWLEAFYSSISPSRSVLLLMDNHSAHISGAEVSPPPSHVKIQWLPPNSTSLYQPLDQGIINTIKLGYRKHWLLYMIQEYEQQRDPIKSMNLYLAIRWVCLVWSSGVSDGTIYRCFRKAQILPSQQAINLPSEPPPDLTSIYQTVRSTGQIQDMMDLSQFLSPADENIEDESQPGEPDIAEIIARHVGNVIEEELDEMDDPEVEIVIPTAKEAMVAIELLQRFKQHQSNTTSDEIKVLNRLQHSVEVAMINQKEQGTLDSWIR
jgi:hypothetical protein